jgi:hypothetical protein
MIANAVVSGGEAHAGEASRRCQHGLGHRLLFPLQGHLLGTPRLRLVVVGHQSVNGEPPGQLPQRLPELDDGIYSFPINLIRSFLMAWRR